jgi:hypothetical protein
LAIAQTAPKKATAVTSTLREALANLLALFLKNPMRMLIAGIAVLVALYAGEWIYRGFLRPIDQPTSAMRALVDHFNTSGVRGKFYPVRHGFRHSSVIAVIAYEETTPAQISVRRRR